MTIRKQSISIAGHRTSFSLEEPFLQALKLLAERRGMTLAALVRSVDTTRPQTTNLSSALRLVVLADLQQRCGERLGAPTESDIQPSGTRSGTSSSS
ncbi:ribbon-helix-helix domain-containing protein [Notoacmeibacter ruber]|uniref:Aryl-sulfate sulfotransferase n=1 Tax=Notoacmeibacter ruber TaxID=2670375 RepID=A0A3L7JCF8_9HYPH|nr:ribbon-helix-helix domain-containing protein [Notoacmeibacter ruber]RLQ88154.1 aryl-sulfate sulfotransferase [Notoacmeibacter ruber]